MMPASCQRWRLAVWPAAWPLWAWAVAIFAAGVFYLGRDLGAEPHFIDESAYISQSFYFDLLTTGAFNDPAWLEFPALDVPPLVKYLIGLSLWLEGHPRHGLAEAGRWYGDQSFRPETPAALVAARRPSVVFGAVGCVAVFAIGALAGSRGWGALAAVLLMTNPLYHMLARRAMCDVPTESLTLVAIALGLWTWQRTLSGRWRLARTLAAGVLVGMACGLAVLAKLNGGLGLMTVGGLAVFAAILWLARRIHASAALAVALSALISAEAAYGTFVALNPHLTADPHVRVSQHLASAREKSLLARTVAVLKHRVAFSERLQKGSPADALLTLSSRAEAVGERGFGRYGTLGLVRPGPAPRYDRVADGRWPIWLVWVLVGAGLAAARGCSQLRDGHPPSAWAILLISAVSLITITAYIPLAWDRYFLPIQPCSSLLASAAAVEGARLLAFASTRVAKVLGSPPSAFAGGAIAALAAAVAFTACRGYSRTPLTNAIALSTLPCVVVSNGWGPVERDSSNGERIGGDGHPMKLRGITYSSGIGVHAGSDIRIPLRARYRAFRAVLGIDDEVGGAGSVTFEVWADGEKLFESGLVTGRSAPEPVSVEISGRRELRLIVRDGGDGPHHDHADWAAAALRPVQAAGCRVPYW